MKHGKTIILATLTLLGLALCGAASGATTVTATVDRAEIGMGESVTLTTRVSTGYVATRSGHRVIPFVNGKRWGAIEVTDDAGTTIHHLPLPNPGPMELKVLVEAPLTRAPQAAWIWGNTADEGSTQYFQRTFEFTGKPENAQLRVAVDDEATIFLNGEEIATVGGWRDCPPIDGIHEVLLPGENVLSVAAKNGGGLAGLLVRMDGDATLDSPALLSGADWTYFPTAPYGWPYRAEVDGEHPRVLADVEWSPYRRAMNDWPALPSRALDMTGALAPMEGLFSKAITVNVRPRQLQRTHRDSKHRVGIQFEPWFTPKNARWDTAHAIPLMGTYWSWDQNVIRQQMIWLAESGIDFLIVDWTNHLWGKAHWRERPDAANEIIHATTMLLETLAVLRDEGQTVPRVALYTGLNNGPSTTVEAVNEMLAWIHNTYIRNPRFHELFEEYLAKPLILAHNGSGPEWVDSDGVGRLDDSLFTIRYQSYHHEYNDHADHGFWSWMDGTLEPVPTLRDDKVEALTVSTAFFGQQGWWGTDAHGRRGGGTLLAGFRAALKHRPQYLQLHQFQEFAGQWEGFGYGAQRNLYVDSYSVELSDDIEPVSRTAAAYRGQGGWGFYYLNLLRALVDCYHQETPETTVIVLSQPTDGSRVSGESLDISWDTIGKEPSAVVLRVNDVIIERDPDLAHHTLDLADYRAGPLAISVTAEGTSSRYPLSYSEASLPRDPMVAATAKVACAVVTP